MNFKETSEYAVWGYKNRKLAQVAVDKYIPKEQQHKVTIRRVPGRSYWKWEYKP